MIRVALALTSAGVALVGSGALDGASVGAEPVALVRPGEPERGERVFQKCDACHSALHGETGLAGSNLGGVIGRAVASLESFAYSPILATLPGRGIALWWSETALDDLVADRRPLCPA